MVIFLGPTGGIPSPVVTVGIRHLQFKKSYFLSCNEELSEGSIGIESYRCCDCAKKDPGRL